MNTGIKITSIVTSEEIETDLLLSDVILITRPNQTFTITVGGLRDLLSDGDHATRHSLSVEKTDNTSDLMKPISNATQGALNNKSDLNHTHDLQSHSHIVSDTTGLQSELNAKAPFSHTHTIPNVVNLQSELDDKSDVGHTHPTAVHSHIIDDTTGLQAALNGKAAVTHSHTIPAVTNLQSSLDNKSDINHTHPSSLQTRDGTADVIIGHSPHAYYPCNDTEGTEIRALVGYHMYKEFKSDVVGGRTPVDEPITPWGTWKAMRHQPSAASEVLESQGMPDLTEFTILMGLKPVPAFVGDLQILIEFRDHNLIMEGGRLGIVKRSNNLKEMMGYIMMVPSYCMISMSVDVNGVVTLKMGPNVTTLTMTMPGAKPLDKIFRNFTGHSQHIAIWQYPIADSVYTSIYKSFRNMENVPQFSDLAGSPELTYDNRDKVLTADSTGSNLIFTTPSGGSGGAHTHPVSEVSGLQTALDDAANGNHDHEIADTTDLQSALDDKASVTHTHPLSGTAGLQTALDGKSEVGHTHAVISHTHIIGNTTGLQAALDDKSELGHTHAVVSHTHSVANTTGLQAALDSKSSGSHAHTISHTTGLQAALDDKASTTHTHALGNTTGLQTALDAKAPTSHTHTVPNVTGLQTALDGKAASSHTHPTSAHSHPITEVTGLQTALDSGNHSHVVAEVTGLQTALDSKSSGTHAHNKVIDTLEAVIASHNPYQYFPMNDDNYTSLIPTIGVSHGHLKVGNETQPNPGGTLHGEPPLAVNGEYKSMYVLSANNIHPFTHSTPKTFGDFSVTMAVKINQLYSTTIFHLLEFDDFRFTIQGDRIGLLEESSGLQYNNGFSYTVDEVCYIGFTHSPSTGIVNLFVDGEIVNSYRNYTSNQSLLKMCNYFFGHMQHLTFYDRVLEYDKYMEQYCVFKGLPFKINKTSVINSYHYNGVPWDIGRPFFSQYMVEKCRLSSSNWEHRVGCELAPSSQVLIQVKIKRPTNAECGVNEVGCYSEVDNPSHPLTCGVFTGPVVAEIRINPWELRGRVCVMNGIPIQKGDQLVYVCAHGYGLKGLNITLQVYAN